MKSSIESASSEPTVLGSIGITIDISTMESYPLIAILQKMMYGTHLSSRAWCRYIRPILFPQRQAEIEQAYDIAIKHYTDEFIQVVIDKSELIGDKNE